MFFHDQIARKAILDGNTSREFRIAAQNHANATWFVLIVAAVVWYFTSFMWALIPLALTAFKGFQSISATMVAIRLEKHESIQSSAQS